MPLFQDTAIVLRRLDYSESSQVLAVFTRAHGQQRLIAKGIKRSTKTRVAVGLDLLEYGDLTFSMRPDKPDTMAALTEWRQRDHFPGIRRDLLRSHAAQYAAEVTSRLTETHDPHPGLFDSLLSFLIVLSPGALAETGVGPANSRPLSSAIPSLVDYLWTLLTELGLRPELDVCVGCRRPIAGDPVHYFSSRDGGVVCRDCEPAFVDKRRIPQAVVRSIGRGAAAAAGRMDDSAGRAAFDLLDYHLTETLAGPPKLSGPLRGLVGLPARSRRPK